MVERAVHRGDPAGSTSGGRERPQTVLTYNTSPNAAAGVVGSGPYELLTYDQTKVVWVKNPSWWGKTLLGLDVKPTYIIDEVNGSNNVELGQMLNGQIDLSNNFLPGVNSIVSGIGGYGIQTYYAKPPYMLSANTAWLVTNDVKKPTNDPVFRRALAESINVSQIVNNVYGQIVQAANPTGLLPNWNQFVDKSVVAKYGYTYNPTDAKKILTAAGYKMGSDGYFRNKDGSTINLSLIVPSGWTDWMAAIQSIAQSAKKAGIRITPSFPSYNDRTNKVQTGKFDLAIANDAQIANTPWAYYNWMFRQPILATQVAGNDGRYKNSDDLEPGPAARRDVDQQRRRDEEDHLADPDHPAAGPADHPALVQRRVVAGEQQRLDQLAVLGGGQPALHARHVGRVLEHGRGAHAHDAEAEVSVSRESASLPPNVRGEERGSFSTIVPGGSVRRYFARKLVTYLLTFFVAVTVDWMIPRFMPGDPVSGHALPHVPAARRGQQDDGLLPGRVRAGSPALAAVPQLLGRALPWRSGHQRVAVSGACHQGHHGSPAVHPAPADPRDPPELDCRETSSAPTPRGGSGSTTMSCRSGTS